MNLKKLLLSLIATFTISLALNAQNVAIKTNLLADVTLNVDAGVEVGLAPRWSLDLTGQYNGWSIDGHKWKHWFVQPEARFWFCDRFNGHFLGIHALGGQYGIGNLKNGIKFLGSDFSQLSDNRFEGWAVGGGIAYGYSWILGNHWNIEAEIGIGYLYTRYDKYECVECGRRVESDKSHNYFGPTKAAVNLVYIF